MDTERIDDRLLLERFRRGDRDALSSLYQAHHPSVYRFALYMTDDPDASSEVVQDTFLWLIDHPAAFDPDRGSLRSFLAGVARKLLQYRARHSRRFSALPDSLTVESTVDGHIEARNLREAIVALPEDFREVVVLCGIENKTYDEAAAIIGCAVGTVRSRLYRAKAQLTRQLNPPAVERTTHG